MKNKINIFLLLILSLFVFVGCDYFTYTPDEPTDEHVHEYPSTWSFDETYHYKSCIDTECSSVLKEQHKFVDGICTVCGYDTNEPVKTMYKVTFINEKDEVIETQTVEKGRDAKAPQMTNTDTIQYDGWDNSFTNVQSDLTIKVLYTILIPDKDEYTLTFDLNGGTWDYQSKEEFTYAFLSDFYDFCQPECDLDTFMYDSERNFKGEWKEYIGGSVGNVNKLLYKNNIDENEDSYFFNSSTYKTKWYCLSYFAKNSICATNKRFGGSENSYEYGALDFYRYVSNDPYIYIDYYGGEETFYSFPKQNTEIISVYKYGVETDLPKPVSRLFDYWVNAKGEKITKITETTKGDLVLKSVWKETETYNVSFNTDGGNTIDDIVVAYNQTFDLPTPVKEGFTFKGWLFNGKTFTATKFLYHTNITLVASWKDNSAPDLEDLVYDDKAVTYRKSTTVVQIPTTYNQKDSQLRACWVSSFAGDFDPSTNKDTMKKNLTEVLDIMDAFNMNCIIFHIRTHNQAFYKTNMTYISSGYGTYESFEEWDYLTWFIEECHKRGIEFHAWLNPYRVVSSGATDLETVAAKWTNYPDNPAGKVENLLMNSDGGVIMNPGISSVRDYIVDICLEIMQNYDVDAIHFDDYFYIKGVDDTATMNANNPTKLSKANWRRAQVDAFIEQLSSEMRQYNIQFNKHVQLGISPTGIYKNGDGSLESGSNSSGYAHYGDPLYADTYHWIKEGWIDYIMPQIYWGFTHPSAPFADISDWWSMACAGTGVNFYAGMGLYMSMNAGKNYSWGLQEYEVSNQILYTTKLENCQGISFYKWASLRDAYNNSSKVAHNGVMRLKNEYWTTKVPTPTTMSTNYNYKNLID